MTDVVNNVAIQQKLESISQDIKTYVNMNAFIGTSLPVGITLPMMDKEDIEELLDIRDRIKQLSRTLKEKNYNG